jgi:hypothetical protein
MKNLFLLSILTYLLVFLATACEITESKIEDKGIFIRTDKSVYNKHVNGLSDTVYFLFSNFTDSTISFFNPLHGLELLDNGTWKLVSHADIASPPTPLPGETVIFSYYLSYMNCPHTDTFRSICEYKLTDQTGYKHVYTPPYLVYVDTLW